MSGFSQFVGAVAGQVASRLIMNKVVDLGQREPGGYKVPPEIPGGVPVERQPAEAEGSRFKIPNWMFFTGYGALLWYAAKATAPVDMPDLGAEPESDLLFPSLKREITSFDIEDVATSDDPVEACLERSGWKLPRIDELRQSIFEKEQVDLFTTPEPLTRSEGELLDAIETCMQKLESQYGSLEAAGVACSVCDGDDPDLGAAEIKETREDWIARHEAPGQWRYMWQRPGEEPKQVSDNKAYHLNLSTAPGRMYLLRAISANAARKLIATGRFTPLERERRKSPKGKDTEPAFYPRQQSLSPEPEQLILLGDGDDLSAVQREMFDPEEQELTLYPGPTAPKHMQAKEGPDTFWFFIAKGFRKANLVTQDQIDSNPDWYFSAEKDKKGKLYQVEADTKVKALKKLHDQLKAAREYTKEYGRKENKFTPWFNPVESGGKGFRILPNIMAHPKTAKDRDLAAA